jgi:hypothetical protein
MRVKGGAELLIRVGREQAAPKLDFLIHALDAFWTNKKLMKARQAMKQRGLHPPYLAIK